MDIEGRNKTQLGAPLHASQTHAHFLKSLRKVFGGHGPEPKFSDDYNPQKEAPPPLLP